MTRLPSIDVLRITVVAFVVLRHTYPDATRDVMACSISVPFFFFLTGWLSRRGSRTLRAEFHRRWCSLGKPYISWLILLYIPFALLAVLSGTELGWTLLKPILGGSYATRPFTTFWFISTLFTVALLMRALDRLKASHTAVVGLLSLGAGAAFGENLTKVPLGLGLAVGTLFFAIAGYFLRGITRHRGHSPLVALAALLIAGAASIYVDPIDIKQGEFGTPVASALVAVIAIWGAIQAVDLLFGRFRLRDGVAHVASSLATVAIMVILLHPAILWVVKAPSVGAPQWVYFAALLIPYAAALIISRTRLAPWLIGQERRAREGATT